MQQQIMSHWSAGNGVRNQGSGGVYRMFFF